MFHIVLFRPEIPPNTGNVIRLAANTGCRLHLVRPLGFAWDDRRLKRAGLDYHEWASVQLHDDLPGCLAACGCAPDRVFAFSTRATRCHADAAFRPGDALLFGSETAGLPDAVLATLPPAQRLRLPMQPDAGRSLNLANCVAVTVYEAWRQNGFTGAG
jgi:tRNA (cytidine/uridine-2'-O-)-methyltransferase